MLTQWEYLSRFMYAHIDNEGAREYFAQEWFEDEPAKYAPESMIPELDRLGKQGWELVHMQPIPAVGKHQDVGFNADLYRWSNPYFCVFKRPKA